MKTVCIHQPDFAPYLGFFERLLQADCFVVLDDAQFIKGGWHNRDKIKTKYGEKWISLSVKKKFPQLICDVELTENSLWIANNLNLLRESYNKAPFFEKLFLEIDSIYKKKQKKLIDINLDFIHLAFEYLNIDIPIVFSSELDLPGKKSERLVSILKKLNASHYLTGTGSKEYLDTNLFNREGINVLWQKFNHPQYPQLFDGFIPMLSCLDLFFNCGENSSQIIRKIR